MSRAPTRIHRGSVEARGFWVDERLLGERATRRRLLQNWSPEASLHTWRDGYLLLLPTLRRVGTRNAPGLVLCDVEHVLANFEATAEDVRRCGAQIGDVLLLHKGCVDLFRPSEETRVDASDWISLDGLGVQPVTTILDPERTAPPLSVQRPREARRIFADKVPAESPGAMSLRQMLEKGPVPASARRVDPGGFVREGTGLLAVTLSKILRRLSRRGEAAGSGTQHAPRSLSLFSRFMLLSRLSRVIGWRQAGYIRRMLDILGSGDLEQSLRHAIPLGGETPEYQPSWRLPAPRSDLTISGRRSGGGSLFFGDELYTHLRQAYRQMFRRLDNMGRTEQAAFVLAELLNANAEAVRYLETHGMLREAAELAEARQLSPGLVVRQWIVAGDAARAFGVARRTDAFAVAVSLLEHHGEREQAAKLRLVWAASLAESGRYGAAVDAVWPIEEARSLALDWLQRALDSGTPSGARALARKLSLLPDQFEETRATLEQLLTDESRDAAALREAFATELLSQKASRVISVAARACYRALLRDRSLGANRWTRRRLDRLVKLSHDAALGADDVALSPPDHPAIDLGLDEEVHEYVVRGEGLIPVTDARLLPRDRVLAALGEAGLRVLNQDGKTLRHFDVPAQHLVLSDAANRALALMPRDDFMVISRVDLDAGTARVWHETALQSFAASYDASLLFAEIEGRLVAIDVLARRFEALWSTGMPGRVEVIVRDDTSLHLSVAADDGREVWQYELPSLTLRQRRPFPAGFHPLLSYSLRPGPKKMRQPGAVCGLKLKRSRGHGSEPHLVYRERLSREAATERPIETQFTAVSKPVLTPDWTILRLQQESEVTVLLLDA
ncbi:MAG: hypothetical protein JSW67_13180, partial [Candidatus Latescibacterota bacterium]